MMVNNSILCLKFTSPTVDLPKHVLETGGLLRIGIKLMMACSTTNVDV